MSKPTYVIMDDRGVVTVSGPDRRTFLQGLISQDVNKVAPDQAAYGALLTPQGKYLHDFFLAELDDALLLDCEADRADDLRQRLSRFKLRAKVTLAVEPERRVIATIFGHEAAAACGLPDSAGAAGPLANGIAFVDPRIAAVGCRAILPAESGEAALSAAGLIRGTREDYDAHRLAEGVPDGSRDMELERATLLESNFEELNGVDWDKGCYMGQEVTARTKYRGLVKKRLMPVAVDGPLPASGTPIQADGRAVGTVRSGHGSQAMVLLRLDALESGTELTAAGATLRPVRPAWAEF